MRIEEAIIQANNFEKIDHLDGGNFRSSQKTIRLQIRKELEQHNLKKGKNKGLKKKIRGRSYKLERKKGNREFDPEHIGQIIKDFIPKEAIARSAEAGSHILCPYHCEKSASMFLSHSRGVYKCFGCGRAGKLEELLAGLLGNTKKFREQIMFSLPQKNTQQLRLELNLGGDKIKHIGNLTYKIHPIQRKDYKAEQAAIALESDTDDLPF